MDKKNKYFFNSSLTVFILLGIFIVISLLSFRYVFRVDLTENKVFTLSEATQRTLEALNDRVTVKVYFSEKLPPQFLALSQSVKDTLDEYEKHARGNIVIQYIDPVSDPNILNEVASLGIPEIKMNILEKDKYQVQAGYLGMALFYLDKEAVFPVVQDTKNLEYELTAALKKIFLPELKKVAFTSGHGEHSVVASNAVTETPATNDYQALAKELQKNYEVITVDLAKDSLEEVATLILAGPKSDFSPEEISKIETFIASGKNTIFLLDTIQLQGTTASALTLDTLLGFTKNSLGVELPKSIVYDASHESAGFTQGFFRFLLPYPFWVKALAPNFSADNPIFSSLESVVFPWASPLVLSEKAGITSEILIKTSEKAGLKTEPFVLNPDQSFDFSAPTQHPLAVLLRKQISGEAESSIQSNIVVIGDSDFVSDSHTGQFGQNLVFMLNTIDHLTLDSDLIEIRSKSLEDRPLDASLTEGEKAFWKYFVMFASPLVLIIYGLIRFYFRKKKKQSLFISLPS